MPPDMNLPEYDEEEIVKEHEEANADPVKKLMDHEDDQTAFEICLINKDNTGLFIESMVC